MRWSDSGSEVQGKKYNLTPTNTEPDSKENGPNKGPRVRFHVNWWEGISRMSPHTDHWNAPAPKSKPEYKASEPTITTGNVAGAPLAPIAYYI